METRRTFLASAVFAGVSLCSAAVAMQVQSPQNPEMIPPQLPGRPVHDPTGKDEGPPMPDAEKKILEENDKDMKKKVERLYQLASELKDQVNKTDSTKVFSLDLVKKAEEVEHLAREIKNHAKG